MSRSPSGGKEVLVLAASLVVTLGLLGAGGYWLWQNTLEPLLGGGSGGSADPTTPAGGELATPNPAIPISQGQASLVPNPSVLKSQGIAAYGQGDYDGAIAAFAAALEENRNDPEALIYLNNARIGNQAAHTVAIVVPLGGSEEASLELLRGVAQAQQESNTGSGVPLKVAIADDGDDPDQAERVAEALAADPEVLAVVGHFSSGVTLAAEPEYTQAQLPLISPTSTALSLTNRSEYFWRTVPSDRFTAAALSRHIIGVMDSPQVAVFYNNDSAYSRSLKDEFTTALFSDGGAIVGEFDVAAGGFDGAQAVEQANQRGAEVLMLATNTGTMPAAIAVIQANQGRLALLGGDSLYNPQILEQGRDSAEGMVVAIPWHILAQETDPFVQSSRSLWGGDVNWRTAMAYDAIAAIETALASLPSPSRQSLQTVLRNPDFQANGASGPVRFLPSGDRNQATQLVHIVPGQRSGYGYDYEPLP